MRIFLKINEITQLLESSRDHPRDHALFHLAFSTGFRISDLLALRRDAILERDGTIVAVLRVKMIKTRQWISRPLRDDCREALKGYLFTRTDELPWLFISESNHKRAGAITRQSGHVIFKKYLGRIFSRSMLAGASTHSLRRSAAKLIALKTNNIGASSVFLGHHSINSTMTYLDVDSLEEKANEAVMNIDL